MRTLAVVCVLLCLTTSIGIQFRVLSDSENNIWYKLPLLRPEDTLLARQIIERQARMANFQNQRPIDGIR